MKTHFHLVAKADGWINATEAFVSREAAWASIDSEDRKLWRVHEFSADTCGLTHKEVNEND